MVTRTLGYKFKGDYNYLNIVSWLMYVSDVVIVASLLILILIGYNFTNLNPKWIFCIKLGSDK